MTCLYDTRWVGPHGIGRFAAELARRLPVTPFAPPGRPMSPRDPLRLSLYRFRPDEWFLSPGYNAPLVAGAAHVLTLHDLNHLDRPDNSSLSKRLYYATVLRRVVGKARAVLTVSEFSRHRIVEWSGLPAQRVFNVGNGVSAGFGPDGPRSDIARRYVLCVGNRRGHKNEPALLRAFAVAALPCDVRLVFTGQPSPALETLARELGLGERLVFCGDVSEDELADLYRGAMMLAFPSLYEGFGLPIVEAFACGTPVLTSNVTSMPEIAGDAAMLVDPYTPEAIAAALRRLFDSPDLRAELAGRGLIRASAFGWDAVAARVRAAVAAVDTDPVHPLAWSVR